MKIFINFADDNFAQQQKTALFAAKLFGSFDKIIGYGPKDVDSDFFMQNEKILKIPRGAGLWLWKPYFILKTLNESKEGDYIFYLDSGFFITKKINHLIESLDASNQDIMTFQTYYPEQQWTKKSLFEKMDCNEDKFRKTNQFVATACLVKNTAITKKFISQWLELASEYENISDATPKDFEGGILVDHRHDQSIYSLLCKKRNLKPFRMPYIFGELGAAYAVMKKTALVYKRDLEFNFKQFENSNYPTMLHVNKSFKFFGINMNLFFVAYVYLKLLNILPFKSKPYNTLLGLGTKGL